MSVLPDFGLEPEVVDAYAAIHFADPWSPPSTETLLSVPDYASDFAAFFEGECEEAELVCAPVQTDEQYEAIRRAWYVLQRDTPSDPRIVTLYRALTEGGR